MNTFETGMTKLLVAQLSELYFCENQLLHALDRMAQAAHDQELKQLFLDHRSETKEQVRRLESAFASMGEVPRAFPCQGVEGLLADGQWLIHTMKDDPVLDTALIAAAQKVENIEAASYRSAITLARQLGREDVAQQCEANLDEELEADRKLAERAQAMHGEHA